MEIIGANGQLFGWSESTWLWLDQGGIIAGDVMITLTMVGGIWAWMSRESIHRWFRTNRFPSVGGLTDEPAQWDALIFTVSRPEVPEWVIQQTSPKAIGLLATHQSMQMAHELAAETRKIGITLTGPKRLDDANDPAEARDEIAHLILRLRGMGHQRIAVDITGGKTPMSIGAFMAAEEAGCDTIYVSSEFDSRLRKPDMGTAKICRISRAT